MRLVQPICESISTATAGIPRRAASATTGPEAYAPTPTTQSGRNVRRSLQASTAATGSDPSVRTVDSPNLRVNPRMRTTEKA